MAIAYHNPIQADDSGDGLSFANAKKTLNAASVVAGAGGTIRSAGLAVVNKGLANWTNGSKTVVFNADAALVSNDYIRPQATDAPICRVASYVAGTKTATLREEWWGNTGSYSTDGIPYFSIGANETLAATGQTLIPGWDPATNTLADGYFTMWAMTSANLAPGNYNTTINADGRFGLDRINIGSGPFLAGNLGTRITGTIDIQNYGGFQSAFTAQADTGGEVEIDTILSHYAGFLLYSQYGSISVRRLVAHELYGAAVHSLNNYKPINVGSMWLGAGQPVNTSNRGVVSIGSLTAVNWSAPVSYGEVRIGTLTQTQGRVPTGGTWLIGGPATEWRRQFADGLGVWIKTTGRGGGYGIVGNPGQRLVSTYYRIALPVAAGASLSLKFYAVYTGTLADPPPCFVRLLEPNGLTVEDIAFTPVRSANTPGGTPDGWADATQQTITFTGTTSQAGSVAVGIFCRDNAAGDALLYLDDFTWTPALSAGTDFGANEYNGLEAYAFALPAAGGGFMLPEGMVQ